MARTLVTDSVPDAAREITDFWRNYDSLRWVGPDLVLRLRNEVTDAELVELNHRFTSLLASGSIERTGPLAAEVTDSDRLSLPRLKLRLDHFQVGSLHLIIRAINMLPSAPAH